MQSSFLLKKICTLFLFLIIVKVNFAQTEFNRQYKFKDGIYMSAMDFRNDSPTIPPEDYTYKEKTNNSLFQKELYYFKMIDAEKYLSEKNTKKIWGICIDGIPYINQHHIIKNQNQDAMIRGVNDYYVFNQIVMIGNICTITAEGHGKSWTAGPLDDPFPFNSRNVKYEKRILKLESGELLKMNDDNLWDFIKEDEALFAEFKNDVRRKKKLDEYIVRYNQRNPIYIEKK